MSYSRRSRYSRSPSYPRGSRYRSISRSMSRSRSRSQESTDAENPGNNLYVTGLSPRITKRELEKHFSTEGKVTDVHLVVDPWTRESRGFAFITMSTIEEAECCIKYLDRSVLEGRVISVEKARRARGRTPTPGRYLGLRTVRVHRRSPSCGSYRRSCSPYYSSRRGRSPSRSPYYRHRGRNRSYSRYYRHRSRRSRSYSPYYRHQRRRSRSYSPYYRHRSSSRSYSPYYRYRDRSPSYSPYYRRNRYYRRSSLSSRGTSSRARRMRAYSRSWSSCSISAGGSYDSRRSPSSSRSMSYRSASRARSRSLSGTVSPRSGSL